MKIVFVSGKGGTGKTTFSTNFFYYNQQVIGKKAVLIDTDVEAPNSYLFFEGNSQFQGNVYLDEVVIDEKKCTLCKKCVEHCQFNALAQAGKKIITFPYLCHGCGMCKLVCEVGAISYRDKELGKLWKKEGETGEVFWGTLNIGESLAPPVIEKLIEKAFDLEKEGNLVIIDAPPGATCPAVAASEEADFAVIVAESTPFGFHDFKGIVALLEKLNKPMGVIINRADLGNDDVENFCKEKGIPVLLKVPFDKEQARVYGDGRLILTELQEKVGLFEKLNKNLEKEFLKI